MFSHIIRSAANLDSPLRKSLTKILQLIWRQDTRHDPRDLDRLRNLIETSLNEFERESSHNDQFDLIQMHMNAVGHFWERQGTFRGWSFKDHIDQCEECNLFLDGIGAVDESRLRLNLSSILFR